MAMRLATVNQLRNAQGFPMNGLFRDLFAFPVAFGENPTARKNGPLLDLFEKNDEYLVKGDFPGFDKDSINLSYENKVLTVSGERKREETEGVQYHRVESYAGKFTRSVKLPIDVNVEKISAELSNGVLTVHLPKAETARPKQISISIG